MSQKLIERPKTGHACVPNDAESLLLVQHEVQIPAQQIRQQQGREKEMLAA